jgi:hypothetical protein
MVGDLEPVFAEVTLCFDSRLTARSCRGDSLAIERVSYVARSEDPWDAGVWRSSFGLDVADFIDFDIVREEFGIGVMTDGEEEAVDGEIYTLFVWLTETLDQMCAFDAIFSVETERVVLIEDGDLLVGCDALTHNVGGTEIVFAYDHIDVRSKTCQVKSFFASGVTTTDYGHFLIAVEEAVAGSTGGDAHTCILLLVGKTKVLGRSTRSDDDRVSFDFDTFLEGDDVGSLREVGLSSETGANLRAEAQGLLAEVLRQCWPSDPFGIAREVLYVCGLGELSSRLDAFIEEGGKVSA